ncbi:MAG: hypothetical protein ABI847_05430 [Anaerolineales bacterium]
MSTQPPVSAPPSQSQPAPTPTPTPTDGMSEGQRRALLIGGGIFAVLLVIAAVVGAIALIQRPALAASVRDVFIIAMALEFLLIGVAMVVLIFQLAVLTNMLQHEIKPILDSTNETVNTLRGTTAFLSENLVGPVVKLNSYMAAVAQVADSLGMLGRFGRRKN